MEPAKKSASGSAEVSGNVGTGTGGSTTRQQNRRLLPLRQWLDRGKVILNQVVENVELAKGKPDPEELSLTLDEIIRKRKVDKNKKRGFPKRRREADQADELNLSLDEIIRRKRKNEESLDRSYKRAFRENQLETYNDQLDSGEDVVDEDSYEEMDTIREPVGGIKGVTDLKGVSDLKATQQLADERLPTPVEVMYNLTENGLTWEFETQELTKFANSEITAMSEAERKRRWRVVYNCQTLSGVGVAPRKELAKFAAALDLLEKIKENAEELIMPMYSIPYGSRLNPYIMDLLQSECEDDFGEVQYFLEENVCTDGISGIKHVCVCRIGHLEFYGFSYRSANYAQLFAAREAYEAIMERAFPLDKIVRGEKECGNVAEYSVINSEAHHIYVVQQNGCKYYSKTNLFPRKVLGTLKDARAGPKANIFHKNVPGTLKDAQGPGESANLDPRVTGSGKSDPGNLANLDQRVTGPGKSDPGKSANLDPRVTGPGKSANLDPRVTGPGKSVPGKSANLDPRVTGPGKSANLDPRVTGPSTSANLDPRVTGQDESENSRSPVIPVTGSANLDLAVTGQGAGESANSDFFGRSVIVAHLKIFAEFSKFDITEEYEPYANIEETEDDSRLNLAEDVILGLEPEPEVFIEEERDYGFVE